MTSMTGYGSATVTTDEFQLEVEVKSYNNRYLDIDHTMPYYLASYEMDIDRRIGEVARRGHIELAVRIVGAKNDVNLMVDKEAVKAYHDAFRQIAEVAGGDLRPSLADYLAQEGLLSCVRQDGERYGTALFQALDEALKQFSESREREGKATHDDLVRLGDQVKDGLSVIAAHADELESLVKQNLRSRMDEMLGDQQYDENRILQEVAVMLNRYTINEEVKRLSTHLKAYDGLLEEREPVGKRLDFLCQEMNREINTIGSKSQIVEMNLQVVRMKDSLENIREQIRNIE